MAEPALNRPLQQQPPEAKSGWRVWRSVLGSLIAIPAISAALWGIAAAIAQAVPGCGFSLGDRTCVVGGLDLYVPLALMTMPAAFLFFTIIFPIWVAFTLFWLLYGLVPATISWVIRDGFTLPPAFTFQGEAMRVPRIVAIMVLVGLFAWWWIATL